MVVRPLRLSSASCSIQYPGAGIEGSYDVDGLRSQAVAFARHTVGAGIWRANFKTISARVGPQDTRCRGPGLKPGLRATPQSTLC